MKTLIPIKILLLISILLPSSGFCWKLPTLGDIQDIVQDVAENVEEAVATVATSHDGTCISSFAPEAQIPAGWQVVYDGDAEEITNLLRTLTGISIEDNTTIVCHYSHDFNVEKTITSWNTGYANRSALLCRITSEATKTYECSYPENSQLTIERDTPQELKSEAQTTCDTWSMGNAQVEYEASNTLGKFKIKRHSCSTIPAAKKKQNGFAS